MQPASSVLHSTLREFEALPLSRRTFLQRCTLLATVVPAVSTLQALWQEQPAVPAFSGLRFFGQHEARLLAMLAEILIEPAKDWPNVARTEVVEYIDSAIATADTKTQHDLRQLLGLFENRFVAFLFDWRFEAFSAMEPPEQRAYLRDWMTCAPLRFHGIETSLHHRLLHPSRGLAADRVRRTHDRRADRGQ